MPPIWPSAPAARWCPSTGRDPPHPAQGGQGPAPDPDHHHLRHAPVAGRGRERPPVRRPHRGGRGHHGPRGRLDWWTARRQAAAGATPALQGPDAAAWRRSWALAPPPERGASGHDAPGWPKRPLTDAHARPGRCQAPDAGGGARDPGRRPGRRPPTAAPGGAPSRRRRPTRPARPARRRRRGPTPAAGRPTRCCGPAGARAGSTRGPAPATPPRCPSPPRCPRPGPLRPPAGPRAEAGDAAVVLEAGESRGAGCRGRRGSVGGRGHRLPTARRRSLPGGRRAARVPGWGDPRLSGKECPSSW